MKYYLNAYPSQLEYLRESFGIELDIENSIDENVLYDIIETLNDEIKTHGDELENKMNIKRLNMLIQNMQPNNKLEVLLDSLKKADVLEKSKYTFNIKHSELDEKEEIEVIKNNEKRFGMRSVSISEEILKELETAKFNKFIDNGFQNINTSIIDEEIN